MIYEGFSVPSTLGILVTSDRHLDYVINVTETAHKKGMKVKIYFTGTAVRLTDSLGFSRLAEKASLAVCDRSFLSLGLADHSCGMNPDIFESQAKHADIMRECERYLVF